MCVTRKYLLYQLSRALNNLLVWFLVQSLFDLKMILTPNLGGLDNAICPRFVWDALYSYCRR